MSYFRGLTTAQAGAALIEFTHGDIPRLNRALYAAFEDANWKSLNDLIETSGSVFANLSEPCAWGEDVSDFTQLTPLAESVVERHTELWSNPREQDLDDTLGYMVSGSTDWTGRDIMEIFCVAYSLTKQPELSDLLLKLYEQDDAMQEEIE